MGFKGEPEPGLFGYLPLKKEKEKSFLSLQNESTTCSLLMYKTLHNGVSIHLPLHLHHLSRHLTYMKFPLMDLLLFPDNAFENEVSMECPSFSPMVPLKPNLNVFFLVKYSPYVLSSASPHGT